MEDGVLPLSLRAGSRSGELFLLAKEGGGRAGGDEGPRAASVPSWRFGSGCARSVPSEEGPRPLSSLSLLFPSVPGRSRVRSGVWRTTGQEQEEQAEQQAASSKRSGDWRSRPEAGGWMLDAERWGVGRRASGVGRAGSGCGGKWLQVGGPGRGLSVPRPAARGRAHAGWACEVRRGVVVFV